MHNIDLFANIRHQVEAEVRDLAPEALLAIPEGFNNNILWHVGHLVVTQQKLCYKLSGLPMSVDEKTVARFEKGSSPADWDETPEVEPLLEKLVLLPEKLRDDVEQGVFTTYEPYQTSTGFLLATIEVAIAYNNFHEGLHLGSIRAMKRLAG